MTAIDERVLRDAPRSPYRYRVAIDRDLLVHHVNNATLPGSYCEKMPWPFIRKTDGLMLWITQDQLDAMPFGQWCKPCMEAIS